MRRITGEGITDPGKPVTITGAEPEVLLWTRLAAIIVISEDDRGHVTIELAEDGLPHTGSFTQPPEEVTIKAGGKFWLLGDLLKDSAAYQEVICGP